MPRSSRAGLTLTLAALCVVAIAPVSAGAQAQATTPNRELAKLQEKLAANPTSVAALQAVGYKLYELNRYQEARPLLEEVTARLVRSFKEWLASREGALPG